MCIEWHSGFVSSFTSGSRTRCSLTPHFTFQRTKAPTCAYTHTHTISLSLTRTHIHTHTHARTHARTRAHLSCERTRACTRARATSAGANKHARLTNTTRFQHVKSTSTAVVPGNEITRDPAQRLLWVLGASQPRHRGRRSRWHPIVSYHVYILPVRVFAGARPGMSFGRCEPLCVFTAGRAYELMPEAVWPLGVPRGATGRRSAAGSSSCES
jgi:hypothetical protein